MKLLQDEILAEVKHRHIKFSSKGPPGELQGTSEGGLPWPGLAEVFDESAIDIQLMVVNGTFIKYMRCIS